MSNCLFAGDFGVKADGVTDDTAAMRAALVAAMAAHTSLLLPAGTIKMNLPSIVVQGALAVRGMGAQLTVLVPDPSGTEGLHFDLSQGVPSNNSVEVSDLAIMSWSGSAADGLTIDYGKYAIIYNQSRVANVRVQGFRNGFVFRNCWGCSFENLMAIGGSAYTQSTGAGSGAAVSLTSCINCRLANLYLQFFAQGVMFSQYNPDGPLVGGGCQGIAVDKLITVECSKAINNDAGPADQCGTLQFSNFVLDNGNVLVPGHCTIDLQNTAGLLFQGGQVLQNGGDWQLLLQNCLNPKLIGVDFYAQDNIGSGSVGMAATRGAIVTGCVFGSVPAVSLGGDTSGCCVSGNVYGAGKNRNYGPGNVVENT